MGGGKAISQKLMTHCRREVIHAQWDILLDDEFIEAYTHGIVVVCCDGVTCCFYPRIFTYSADYPEKCVNAPSIPTKSMQGLYDAGFLWPVFVIKDGAHARGVSSHLSAQRTLALSKI